MSHEATPQMQYYIDRIHAELAGRSEEELKQVLQGLGGAGLSHEVQAISEDTQAAKHQNDEHVTDQQENDVEQVKLGEISIVDAIL